MERILRGKNRLQESRFYGTITYGSKNAGVSEWQTRQTQNLL